jgi:hypothetical protein
LFSLNIIDFISLTPHFAYNIAESRKHHPVVVVTRVNFSRNVCSPSQQPNSEKYYIYCIFIIDDENTQIYIIVFLTNHKNTLYLYYIYIFTWVLWWRINWKKRFVKIFATPWHVAHQIKLFVFHFDPKSVMGVFSIQMQIIFSIFQLGLFYNVVILDTVV